MKSLLLLLLLMTFGANAQNKKLSVYFDFNSSTLSNIEKTKLKGFLESKHGNIVSINAYCDTVGTILYNKRLAKKRLASVTSQFDTKEVKTIVNGETEAAASKNYDADQSRRVDIVYKMAQRKLETRTPGAIILEQKFNEFVTSNEQKTSFDLSLLFIPGYPVLIKESIPELRELFELLDENPTIDAHIHGHVCCADDFKLSLDRAIMVRDYLITLGIDAKRLNHTAHSNKLPRVTPEASESDRLMNRRVTVDFIKK